MACLSPSVHQAGRMVKRHETRIMAGAQKTAARAYRRSNRHQFAILQYRHEESFLRMLNLNHVLLESLIFRALHANMSGA